NMAGTARRRANLINLRGCQRLGERRARQPMRAEIGDAGTQNLGLGGAHGFIVLIVRASDQAMAGDLRKTGLKYVWRNARETFRMRAERRELDGRCAGSHHLRDMLRPVRRVHRAIERKIDPRLLSGLYGLVRNLVAGADQVSIVIRHVDDRRHAAGGGRARRPDEVLLAGLGARMNLRVYRARKDKGIAEIMTRARRRRRTFAYPLDHSGPNGDIALLANPVAANHTACDYKIEIAHGCSLVPEDRPNGMRTKITFTEGHDNTARSPVLQPPSAGSTGVLDFAFGAFFLSDYTG